MENAVSMTFIIFTDSAPTPKAFRYDFTLKSFSGQPLCIELLKIRGAKLDRYAPRKPRPLGRGLRGAI